ncbi:hypothetical protein F2P81_022859 [Scophthalmus maximus]|uniref:Uncharacterized protein n=1 Tax=Scophthalmus maximus TaxID=52904 RepID=A0A6A4S1F2_SCOMX|nr:hypothetical protein F2P81_022859 [Scophthalmus maximus]
MDSSVSVCLPTNLLFNDVFVLRTAAEGRGRSPLARPGACCRTARWETVSREHEEHEEPEEHEEHEEPEEHEEHEEHEEEETNSLFSRRHDC